MKKWVSENRNAMIAAIVTVLLAIISWFALPQQVVIQVGFDGNPSNVVPKFIAILIPVVLSSYGCLTMGKSDREEARKGMVLVVCGIGLLLIMMMFNR